MLLPAALVRFKNGDSEYRYRPDSELLYLTGWDGPDCIALFRGFADEDRFVLFAPERNPEKELWTGPRRESEEVRTWVRRRQGPPHGGLHREGTRAAGGG